MAHFYIGCSLTTLCVVIIAAAAAGATLEVYDGTYYGIEDVGGVTSVQVSSQTGTEFSSDDGVTVRPLPPDSDRDQNTRRGDGARRGHHHHRGRHGGHHRHHGHHGDAVPGGSHAYGRMPSFMRGDLMANWTEEQKLTQICNRIQSHSERGRNHVGMLESKLHQMNAQDRQKIVDLWASRKRAMLRCCGMNTMDEKKQCVNEVRTARYERVCRGEETLCPWTRFGSDHGNFSGSVPPISTTTNTCCSRQGADRLQCFVDAKHDYRQRLIEFMSRGPPAHGTTTQPDARRHRRPEGRSDGRSSHHGGRRNRPSSTMMPSV